MELGGPRVLTDTLLDINLLLINAGVAVRLHIPVKRKIES